MERFDRRAFLRRAALLGLALPLAGAAATACGRRTAPARVPTALGGPLPVDAGLLLDGGLPIEQGATLRVYEWKDYLARRVLDDFERANAASDIHVEVSSFTHVDEMVAALQDPASTYDVVFPVIDVLPGMVDAGLLRPLQHEYLPHLRNLWSWFRAGDGPFYDPGQRYTTPYTVYTAGIGWRADMVLPADAPDARADPFAIFTDTAYQGLVGFYDSYREALALGLQRDGVTDLLDATDGELTAAADFLEEAVRVAGAQFTDDGVIEGLPERRFAAHQAWSGDILTAPRYAAGDGYGAGYGATGPSADAAETTAALRYWSPGGPERVVGLDLTAISTRGHNPVAAHAFLDHLMRFDVALDNFAWNGYQVPMDGATREAFADRSFPWHGAVPANLLDAIVSEEDFAAGQMLVGLGPSEDAAWRAQWSRVEPS